MNLTDQQEKLLEAVRTGVSKTVAFIGELTDYHGDAAKLLECMFSEITEMRYSYRKLEYGTELIRWKIENERESVQGLS